MSELRGKINQAVETYDQNNDTVGLFGSLCEAIEGATSVLEGEQIGKLVADACDALVADTFACMSEGEPIPDMAESFYNYFQAHIAVHSMA